MIPPDTARANLDRILKERGYSFAAISRLIGRNTAYIQQYIFRGSPMRLEEGDRRVISDFLGCDERELGGPTNQAGDRSKLVQVRHLAVEASAGPGSAVMSETALRSFGFPLEWLRQLTNAVPEQLSIIRVKGDSMAPTLVDGDHALVDQTQTEISRGDGVYVLMRDDALMVKRVSVTPASELITVSSDNPAHPTWRDCPLPSLRIIGRCVAKVSKII